MGNAVLPFENVMLEVLKDSFESEGTGVKKG